MSHHRLSGRQNRSGSDAHRQHPHRARFARIDRLSQQCSFVRGYEPVYVVTREGKTYNGIVRKDTAEEIVLVADGRSGGAYPRRRNRSHAAGPGVGDAIGPGSAIVTATNWPIWWRSSRRAGEAGTERYGFGVDLLFWNAAFSAVFFFSEANGRLRKRAQHQVGGNRAIGGKVSPAI